MLILSGRVVGPWQPLNVVKQKEGLEVNNLLLELEIAEKEVMEWQGHRASSCFGNGFCTLKASIIPWPKPAAAAALMHGEEQISPVMSIAVSLALKCITYYKWQRWKTS